MSLTIREATARFATFTAIVCTNAAALAAENNAATTSPASDCVQRFENGQRLRKEGKLKAATEALIACSQPVCPTFIAKECTNLYSEAQASLPSVTFRATDGRGQLLTEVNVYLDNELVTKTLDGRAVAVDPGVHELRFELEGKPPMTAKILVAEGEKNKSVSMDFPAPDAAVTTPKPLLAPLPPSSELPAPRYERSQGALVAALVAGGLGVAGVGAGLTLWLIAEKDYSDLEKTCSPLCSKSKSNSVEKKYDWSTVSYVAGGAALVGSGILFAVYAGSSKPVPSARLSVGPVAVGSGLEATWSGAF